MGELLKLINNVGRIDLGWGDPWGVTNRKRGAFLRRGGR